MRRIVGVAVLENVAAGAVEGGKLVGPLQVLPEHESGPEGLLTLPAEEIARQISERIAAAAGGQPVDAIGAGFPGIIRNGVIEESPNLQQLKGAPMLDLIG